MSIKDLFYIFSKTDYEKELKKKISALEMDIKEIEAQIAALNCGNPDEPAPIHPDPPIIIEKIHIEKIILDKYELNNNFGQLGIKELKGKLNIGATYGYGLVPGTEEADKNTSRPKRKQHQPNTGQGPKVNIRGKRES